MPYMLKLGTDNYTFQPFSPVNDRTSQVII